MSLADWFKRRLSGVAPSRSDALEIEIEGQTVRFQSSIELEVALAPRTEVPATLLRQVARMSDEQLRDDLNLNRAVHKKLTHMMLRAMETGVPLAQVWREIDLSKIYEEHQWQALLYALSDPHAVSDAYRRAALVKYLQYLRNRRETLLDLQRERGRAQAQGPLDHAPPTRLVQLPGPPGEDLSYTSMQRGNEFSRLPPRHSVELTLKPGEPVTLFLAHRRMRLTMNEEGAVLTDDSGLTVPLHEGRLVIGRSNDCDVVLRDAPADVSRKHLMIEAGHQEVRLTDLSSHGTYVPKRALSNTQTRH
jgi:hypothetical protein